MIGELRKSYLSLIQAIFGADLDRIFRSPENAAQLEPILESVLQIAASDADLVAQRAALAILAKVVDVWAVPTAAPLEAHKIPAFVGYVLRRIQPVVLQLPLSPSFNIGDAQTVLQVRKKQKRKNAREILTDLFAGADRWEATWHSCSSGFIRG